VNSPRCLPDLALPAIAAVYGVAVGVACGAVLIAIHHIVQRTKATR